MVANEYCSLTHARRPETYATKKIYNAGSLRKCKMWISNNEQFKLVMPIGFVLTILI